MSTAMHGTRVTAFVLTLVLTESIRAQVPGDAEPGGQGARLATVAGTVTAGGQAVEGARVTLFVRSLDYFRETRTSADGRYRLRGVHAGSYRLGVAALGFDYPEAGVTVTENGLIRDFSLAPESAIGRWETIGDTEPEMLDATDIALLTADGRIFYCHDTQDPILFDPLSRQKSFPSGSSRSQGCMNGTLLEDGRLVLCGGQEGGDFRMAVPWVKTYAPGGDQWTWLEDMQHDRGRWYPGLARLADGSLLVMGGGQRPNAERTETCERFDLRTQTWRYTGSMVNACEFPPSALLYTGEVLATWSPPQLYNPQTGQWRRTGDFNQPNRLWPGHSDHSIIVLADGRVAAIGVLQGPDDNDVMTEIYDPASQTWTLGTNPELVRLQCEVVQLPNGQILVAGGETEDPNPPVEDIYGIVKWCDLFTPSTGAWRRVADMQHFREYHAVTLLVPDGRVLTTGGTQIKFRYGPTSADIEAWTPPYLLRGVRPEIRDISSTVARRGDRITLEIFPRTRLTGAVLMGVQSTTHWVDGGVPRRIVLPVEQSGTQAVFTLPTDPNVLMLGHYMVFAMVDDIPSVARIILVW